MQDNVLKAALPKHYLLKENLQKRAGHLTFAGQDLQTQQDLIFKFLLLGQVSDWKAVELFEREAKVLKHLEHERVPRLLDNLKLELAGEEAMCLVFSRLPGQSLARRLQAGWRLNEARARIIAQDLLEILVYLHHFSPPLIHRDIKPANVLIDDQGRAALIDFGAVKDVLLQGQTVVGTFGYIAPEQLSGQVLPASDIYALGVTLIEALSACAPSEIPRRDLHWDYHDLVHVSPDFQAWLDQLLSPQASQRPSAQKALDSLENLSHLTTETQLNLPSQSKAKTLELSPQKAALQLKLKEDEPTSMGRYALQPAEPQIQIQHHGNLMTLLGDWMVTWLIIAFFMWGAYMLIPLFLPLWVLWVSELLLLVFGLVMAHESSCSLFLSAELSFEQHGLVWEQAWLGKWRRRKLSRSYSEIRFFDVKFVDGVRLFFDDEDESTVTIYCRKSEREAQWLLNQMMAQMRPHVSKARFDTWLSVPEELESVYESNVSVTSSGT